MFSCESKRKGKRELEGECVKDKKKETERQTDRQTERFKNKRYTIQTTRRVKHDRSHLRDPLQ
jgi:hypothetical protein